MENHSKVYDSDHEDWLRTAYDAGRAQAIDELKPMIKRFMLFVEDSYSTNDEYYIQAKKLLEGSNNE